MLRPPCASRFSRERRPLDSVVALRVTSRRQRSGNTRAAVRFSLASVNEAIVAAVPGWLLAELTWRIALPVVAAP